MTDGVEVPPLTGLIHFFSSRLRVKKKNVILESMRQINLRSPANEKADGV